MKLSSFDLKWKKQHCSLLLDGRKLIKDIWLTDPLPTVNNMTFHLFELCEDDEHPVSGFSNFFEIPVSQVSFFLTFIILQLGLNFWFKVLLPMTRLKPNKTD